MASAGELLQLRPDQFVEWARKEGLCRFYFVFDRANRKLRASDPKLQDLADTLARDARDFADHEGIFFEAAGNGVLHSAFVHSTRRGQAQGGTRLWNYPTLEEFLHDGLRLSRGMTQKNALAGLWWGGGKGVISRHPDLHWDDRGTRDLVFETYGDFISSLKGCYITAEDVGVNPEDVAAVFRKTRFTTCIPCDVGGSGNPSDATASGVLRAMEAALEFSGKGSLKDKKVAVQGMGHVGLALIGKLIGKGAEVTACDVSKTSVDEASAKFKGGKFTARKVGLSDLSILFEDCDVLAPCARGAVLNPGTIPEIRAPLICGAANNQLEDMDRDDKLLHERKILYIPDFLANRMGIVHCANEQYGSIEDDPEFERHLGDEWEQSVYRTTLRVLEDSRKTGTPPGRVALDLADRLAEETHPIFGHRGDKIIAHLIKSGWERNTSA